MQGHVAAVSRAEAYTFSKARQAGIRLLTGSGVENDVHAGTTVKHRSRMRRDPSQPNLRQVHLIHAELLDELRSKGFEIAPGDIGENILTRGIDLLGLPRGARLRIGAAAVVEVTGLRNPCRQLDDFRSGLLAAVLDQAPDGSLIRKAGIMGIVLAGGEVRPGDSIAVELPEAPHARLGPV